MINSQRPLEVKKISPHYSPFVVITLNTFSFIGAVVRRKQWKIESSVWSSVSSNVAQPADVRYSPRHSRKMAYEERDEAASLYISYIVYVIITQTRCTVPLLLAVISEEKCPSISSSPPWEQNLEPAQNVKSESNLMERIHAGVTRLSIE